MLPRELAFVGSVLVVDVPPYKCKPIPSMVDAFFMDVEIIACATVRERDGLALSSRNVLLSCDARKRAAKLDKVGRP